MDKMSAEQRKRIFGLARELGIHEKDNPDDELHALVLRETGKESISKLSAAEADQVIGEMYRLLDKGHVPGSRQKNESGRQRRPGMITPEQVKKVWHLMYQLAELDPSPAKVSLGYRLAKIIEKELKVNSFEKDPFRFVTFNHGGTLIEKLKFYVSSEKRKARRNQSECKNNC